MLGDASKLKIMLLTLNLTKVEWRSVVLER